MKTMWAQLAIGDRVLARGRANERYVARLASVPEEVRAAQTLRFLVFNVELNEGLERSFTTFRDADAFDEVCHHLIVEDRWTGEIVGTYRLQTGRMAAANHGFYSAQEFDLAPFEPMRDRIIELGRACVHRGHRSLAVLGLLWNGIARYAREFGGRYLIGCSSLSTQDFAAGATVYSDLCRRYLAESCWQVQPRPGWACPLDRLSNEPQKVPRLLSAYLSLGARICGAPAVDCEFKTIDFMTYLDLETLSPTVQARYFGEE